MAAADAGWFVFPVMPHRKVPAVVDWENCASRSSERIHAWWEATAFNIGIATGPSGLLVVDLDPAHGFSPPEEWVGARHGADVLAKLTPMEQTEETFDTFTVSTPSGGRHLYFAAPTDVHLRNTQGRLGWRIDTRGRGGYVLAAGSVGANCRYEIVVPRPVRPLPVWLVDALTVSPAEPATPTWSAPAVTGARGRAYLRAVVTGECDAVATAPVGHRHTTLLRAARRLGQWVGAGALAEQDARDALVAAAQGFVGVAGYTHRQIDRDIADGMAYGARRPRPRVGTPWANVLRDGGVVHGRHR